MSRRRRRLLNLISNTATVLSALLCVAVLALWVRSYRHTDTLLYRDFHVAIPAHVNEGWWDEQAGVLGAISRLGRVAVGGDGGGGRVGGDAVRGWQMATRVNGDPVDVTF